MKFYLSDDKILQTDLCVSLKKLKNYLLDDF